MKKTATVMPPKSSTPKPSAPRTEKDSVPLQEPHSSSWIDWVRAEMVLFVWGRLKGVTPETLMGAEIAALRNALKAQETGQLDRHAWEQEFQPWFAHEAHKIDWSLYPKVKEDWARQGITSGPPVPPENAGPQTGAGRGGSGGGGPAADPMRVLGQLGEMLSAVQDSLKENKRMFEKMEERMTGAPGTSGPTNKNGENRSRAKNMLNNMRDSGMEEGEVAATVVNPNKCPKKKAEDTATSGPQQIVDRVREYFTGMLPPTAETQILAMELANNPVTTVADFFSAIRHVGGTVGGGDDGAFRAYICQTSLSERMVYRLFLEGLGEASYLSVKERDGLESKFVTMVKSKMLTSKDFTFVKAAAEAQGVIMKDMKEFRARRPVAGGSNSNGRNANEKCYSCGRKGHKSWECKAPEEVRKKHQESRSNFRKGDN